MSILNRRNRSRGQTALEYALVIGVIVVGVIFAGKKLLGKDGQVDKLMNEAIESARGTITSNK